MSDSYSDIEGFDEFFDAYVECALWSSMDNADDTGGRPLDENYGPEDLSERTIKESRDDCADFIQAHAALIGDRFTRAGHDFWLTRNRHGAGFWDGTWPDDVGKALTDAAHVYGNVDLCVGDDGLIYSWP